MDTDLPSPRPGSLRLILFVTLGLAVLATATGVYWHNRATAPEAAMQAETAKSPAVSLTTAPGAPAPIAGPAVPAKPSFDIVRVNPKGDAVMAGRAAPGARVTIADGGKVIGQAQADQSGDWVFIPSAPLAPGARTLTLSEQTATGTEAKGDRSVVLVVPEPAAGAQQPSKPPALAVLTGPNVPPAVLTGPPGGESGATGTRLGLSAAEYGGSGTLQVAGTAAPGATVRVYMDDKAVGQAVAGPDGKWGLSSGAAALAPGEHRVRVDQLAGNGTVAARIEQAFARLQAQPVNGEIRIAPGQNLWTIARQTYGHGIRYLVIFQANRQAIRDPNLIYPGQVFMLPSASAAPAMPSSSSTSK